MSVNKRLKKRLLKDRPMTSISIRMPEDVLDDLKEIAPGLGFSGYQALIRFYIGQSLRKDLARKESGPVAIMAESLRRHGVSDAVIEEVYVMAVDVHAQGARIPVHIFPHRLDDDGMTWLKGRNAPRRRALLTIYRPLWLRCRAPA